jgi:hypothetical protein
MGWLWGGYSVSLLGTSSPAYSLCYVALKSKQLRLTDLPEEHIGEQGQQP